MDTKHLNITGSIEIDIFFCSCCHLSQADTHGELSVVLLKHLIIYLVLVLFNNT